MPVLDGVPQEQWASTAKGYARARRGAGGGAARSPCRCGGSTASACADLTAVKLDAEGAEYEVLRGARETLLRCRPVLSIEIEERHRPGSTWAVPAFLDALGYDTFWEHWDEWRPMAEFDRARMHRASPNPAVFEASDPYVFVFYALPRERRGGDAGAAPRRRGGGRRASPPGPERPPAALAARANRDGRRPAVVGVGRAGFPPCPPRPARCRASCASGPAPTSAGAVGCSACPLLGTLAAQVVTLFQMGLIRRLPDPPVGAFDSTRVNASDYAYSRLETPDAALMLVNYGVTAALAASGGADRAERNPALPRARGQDGLGSVLRRAARDRGMAGQPRASAPIARRRRWCPWRPVRSRCRKPGGRCGDRWALSRRGKEGSHSTSSIRRAPEASIASRSKPSAMPLPAGIPCSSARRKSSSTSQLPPSLLRAVEAAALRDVALEARALLGGVRQLVEGVGEFHAGDEQLEAQRGAPVGRVAPRERRLRRRPVGEEGRARPRPMRGSTRSPQQAEEQVLPPLALARRRRRARAASARSRAASPSVPRMSSPPQNARESLGHGEALEGQAQVGLDAAMRHHGRADGAERTPPSRPSAPRRRGPAGTIPAW